MSSSGCRRTCSETEKRSLALSHAFGSSGLSQELRIVGSAKHTVPNEGCPFSACETDVSVPLWVWPVRGTPTLPKFRGMWPARATPCRSSRMFPHFSYRRLSSSICENGEKWQHAWSRNQVC